MNVFIAICVVLALGTLYWLVRPLLRQTPADSWQSNDTDSLRSAQNLVIARERLDELETSHAAGDVNDEDYVRQREDIERALATQLRPGHEQAAQPRSYLLGALLIVAIPAVSVWLYIMTGTPQALDPIHQLVSQEPESREDIETMVNGLAKRMQSDPDNTQGWYRLAQSFMVLGRFPEALQAMQNIERIEGQTTDVLSMFGQGYMVMGRHDDAVEALQKLRAAQGDTPETLLRLADALAMQNDAQLTGEPESLILNALAQQPNNTRALWMAGIAARQRGDNTQALGYWEKLQPMLADQQQALAELNALIDDTRSDLGQSSATDTPDDANAASVTVNVSLDDRLRVNAKPDETVFIFARAANGPRMPLAAQKTTVSALPLTITLSDADAMTPQMNLSSTDKIIIVARVARQGQPIAAPGDLQGESAVIDVKSTPNIVLVIDKIVE